MKNENKLWVQSLSTADVSLSDLGIKVPAGQTINVYKVNPYLTVDQVEKSIESGALFKRLGSKTLRIINKEVANPTKAINKIKASDKPVHARKTKSSVVIESNIDDAEEEGKFEFADYGVNDLGPDVMQGRKDGSVVVSATQDEVEDPEIGTQLKPDLEVGISKQSQIVMRETQKAMVDPTGPIADSTQASVSKPFTVVNPPKPEDEGAESKVTPAGKHVSKGPAGEIIVTNTEPEKQTRSIRTVKKAQEEDDETLLPGDDEVGADTIIDLEETEFDSKVATKTEDGAIVMKLKEDEPE